MKMISEQEIRQRLGDLRNAENKLNKRMTKINWEIAQLEREKKKLTAKVSNNMRHRNILIDKLPNSEQNVQVSDTTEADSKENAGNKK